MHDLGRQPLRIGIGAGRLRCSLALVGVVCGVGCSSMQDSFNDITSALTPTTPRQAADSALDQYDPDRRREGILLLSNSVFGEQEVYVSLYREYTRFDTDPMVRAAAIQALARHGEPDDALLISAHLDDENRHVRWEAAKGLQRLHNPDAVTPLLDSVLDEAEDPDVRAAGAVALGQYPQNNVFQALVAALNASELSINIAAEQSLQLITGMDFGQSPRQWLTWYDEASTRGVVFAGQEEYLYPTYSRNHTFFEQVFFWSKPTFETPTQPHGLRPADERSTYQDDDRTDAGDSAGAPSGR